MPVSKPFCQRFTLVIALSEPARKIVQAGKTIAQLVQAQAAGAMPVARANTLPIKPLGARLSLARFTI